jgi:hypothetical protein
MVVTGISCTCCVDGSEVRVVPHSHGDPDHDPVVTAYAKDTCPDAGSLISSGFTLYVTRTWNDTGSPVLLVTPVHCTIQLLFDTSL